MARFIVDASVAVSWYVNEPVSPFAERLLDHELAAPDFIVVEVAKAVWKTVRRGLLDTDAATGVLAEFRRVEMDMHPVVDLVAPALEFAIEYDRTVYDSLYLALAQRERCQFVTADRRLYNALESRVGDTIAWVEDVPPVDV